MNRAYVALGSNQGDRRSALRQAVAGIRGAGRVSAVSSLYETAPVGGPPQGPYLNAVVEVQTPLEAEPLLVFLENLEREAGRVRTVRFGPRTLDLDLLWWNGLQRDGERLTLPHPRAHERRFVLEPWREVWPVGTLWGQPLGHWLERAAGQPVRRVGDPAWAGDDG